MRRPSAYVIAFVGSLTPLSWVPRAICQPSSDFVLIRDVRVFDGTTLLPSRNVVLQNGRISHVGQSRPEVEGATVIPGDGLTLLPGLIDSHVHIAGPPKNSLGQALSLGVTTVLDMFSGGERLNTLKRIESEDPPGLADLRTAGFGATAPGGHPTQMGGPAEVPTISRAEEAQVFVDARIAEGSDYIKIIYDDLAALQGEGNALPKLTSETLSALVRATHHREKLAVVHVATEEDARDAIRAGADGLGRVNANVGYRNVEPRR